MSDDNEKDILDENSEDITTINDDNAMNESTENSTDTNEAELNDEIDENGEIMESENSEFPIAKKSLKEKLKEFDENEDHFISKRNMPTITFGAIIVFGIIIYVLLFKNGYFTSEKLGVGYPNMPIAYSKGSELYMDDLKTVPYKVTDNLGVENMYSYMFVGVGTDFSENGKNLFYREDVKETGEFNLYHKETSSKAAEGKLIAENVNYFESSDDGKSVVYIKDSTENGGKLCSNDLVNEYALDEGIIGADQILSISGNGKNIAYEKYEGETVNLYLSSIDGTGKYVVSDEVVQFEMPSKSNKLYYIKFTDDSRTKYSLYEAEFNKDPILISDNITGLGVLENKKDIVYMTNNGNTLKYSDIVEDDMIEFEKDIKEPNPEDYSEEDVQGLVNDYTSYSQKLQRDEVRKELATGEMPSLPSTGYVYSEGKSLKIADNIIDSKILGSNAEYVIFSIMPTEKIDKVKMSEITSVQDIWTSYSSMVRAAKSDTYFVKPGNEPYHIEYDNVNIQRTAISKKLNYISFFTDYDDSTRQGQLLLAGIKNESISYYAPLSETATSAQFSGDKSDFAYLDNVKDGIGTLNFVSSNIPMVVAEGVMSYQFGKENNMLYFIDEVSSETGQGNLRLFQSGSYKDIDKDVLAMSVKYNKRVAYIKNYDMKTKTGELYYLKGTDTRLIDKGVTSLFDY